MTDGIQGRPSLYLKEKPKLKDESSGFRATPIFRSNKDIEAKKRELLKMSIMPPEGVTPEEFKEWEWFCKGGICALRWIQGREMGNPNADPVLNLGEL